MRSTGHTGTVGLASPAWLEASPLHSAPPYSSMPRPLAHASADQAHSANGRRAPAGHQSCRASTGLHAARVCSRTCHELTLQPGQSGRTASDPVVRDCRRQGSVSVAARQGLSHSPPGALKEKLLAGVHHHPVPLAHPWASWAGGRACSMHILGPPLAREPLTPTCSPPSVLIQPATAPP